MKRSFSLTFLAIILCAGLFTVSGADKHSHVNAPKGGRLLDKTEPHAELVIEKDRTVTINFYNHDMKPVAPGTQSLTLMAEAKTGKTTMEFEKKGETLSSKTKLPEGEGYNIVVQFKENPQAKPKNFRFKMDLTTCEECKHSEYACTCGH